MRLRLVGGGVLHLIANGRPGASAGAGGGSTSSGASVGSPGGAAAGAPSGAPAGASGGASGAGARVWSTNLVLIIRQNDKDGSDLPGQPRVDPADDGGEFGGRWDGQGLDRFYIVVDLHTTIRSIGSGGDLDQRPRVIPNHLDTRAGIRVPVALGQKLQQADPNLGLGGDPVLDRIGLQSGWPLVSATTEEEGPKLVPDGLRVGHGRHLDIVSHDCVGLPGGGILDEDDAQLLPHEDLDDLPDIANGPILPVLPHHVVRNPGGSLNHEGILEALILEEVGQLGVDGNLVLHNLGEKIKTYNSLLRLK